MSLIPLREFLNAGHNEAVQSKIPETQRSNRGTLRIQSHGISLMKTSDTTTLVHLTNEFFILYYHLNSMFIGYMIHIHVPGQNVCSVHFA